MTPFLIVRAILVIIGGFMVHLSLGTIYTFGNMAPYIVSYIRNQSHPETLNQGTTAWIFALALIGQGGAMFLGGWLVKKIGSRWTTLIGGWTMSAGVALSYFTIKASFWLLLLTYGLVFGIGVGLAYIGPLTVAMRWLPKWKGFANGIVVAGFGLGALIFNAVQTIYINPKNIEAVPDKDGEKYFVDAKLLHRVPYVYLILGGAYAVLQFVGSLLMTDPPEGYGSGDEVDKFVQVAQSGQYREVNDDFTLFDGTGQTSKPRGKNGGSINSHRNIQSKSVSPRRSPSPQLNGFADNSREGEKSRLISDPPPYPDSGVSHHEEEGTRPDIESSSLSSSVSWLSNIVTSLTPFQMLKKPSFYMLWLMFLLGGLAVAITATLYKFFGQEVVNNDHFLASVGSVSAIFNCLGRIVWGMVADNTTYKSALVFIFGIMTAMLLTIFICTVAGKIMFFVWVCVIFFCIGGYFSVFPTAIARAYGAQYVSINYGLLFTSQVIAGSLGALLATVLKKRIGTTGMFFMVSGVTGLGLVVVLLFRPKRYITLQRK